MILRSKAPLRISFAGGGTDVPPYPNEFGGCVLSCTINKYAYTSLTPRKDKKISLKSIDFNLERVLKTIAEIKYDGMLDLPKAVLKKLNYKQAGFDLITSCDSPPGSGLGSSSAIVVSIIGAIKKLLNLSLSSYDIANLAISVERDELKINGGFQDQFASTFGGFNFIEFNKDTLVTPLRISADIENELTTRLLLVDTKKTRFSGDVLSRQVKAYKKNRKQIIRALDFSKKNAYQMKDCLLKGEIDQFGELLEEGWEFKKQRDNKISNSKIDKIYMNAKKEGIIGGKLLGAGGGGHILLLCKYGRRYNVEKKMRRLGCEVIPFTFETKGIQTWKINKGEGKVEI